MEFDYLFLESLFIEKVRAAIPELVEVKGVPDLQYLESLQQNCPSVYVIYLGDSINTSPGGQAGNKKVQVVNQFWAFVLTVSTADGIGDGEQARKEAGPLLGKLINELTGWAPDKQVAPLSRAAKQAPVAYTNGYFYYPIVFTTNFVFPRIRSWQP